MIERLIKYCQKNVFVSVFWGVGIKTMFVTLVEENNVGIVQKGVQFSVLLSDYYFTALQ